MKKLLTYTAVAVLASTMLFSCSKNEQPVFDDANAFIAFSSTSAVVSEDSATISIPVTLASVAGLEGAATFKIVPDTTTTASGKKIVPQEGVHYKVLTKGGTLKFDSKTRTQNIEIQGIYYPEYTGDLSFKIILASSTQKLGYANTCTVAISDVDHPLSSILGSYTATSSTYAYPANSYTMTIYKDETDDHKVWIDNVFGNPGWAIAKTRAYGNVTEQDGKLVSINIPFGQAVEYKYGTSPVILAGLDLQDNIYTTGSVTATIAENGGKITLDFGEEYGFLMYIDTYGPYEGWVGMVYPHITAVKN